MLVRAISSAGGGGTQLPLNQEFMVGVPATSIGRRFFTFTTGIKKMKVKAISGYSTYLYSASSGGTAFKTITGATYQEVDVSNYDVVYADSTSSRVDTTFMLTEYS